MDSISSLINSLQVCIHNAKAFVRENSDKTIAFAAETFELLRTILYNSLARDKFKARAKKGKHGGQNNILKGCEEKAVEHFIWSLLMYSIKPSYKVVYNAVVSLKRTQNPGRKAPTKWWFSTWWRTQNLHKIKTKPTAAVRFTAAQNKDVKAWFFGYEKVLKALGIRDKKNIINFDKAGFKVGCMKRHENLVPIDIKEFYK
ncbi:hypothetical protein MMC22_004251, partial [Lobaria immixta]|nr:hypothetical protein [Lobaria immixta]